MARDKRLYYHEHHKKTYIPKANFCDVCNQDLTGTRKKRCRGCLIQSECEECGKLFYYKVKYRRCPKCQYHWYKKNLPEKFKAVFKRRSKKDNLKLREQKGLPLDHVFPKGPKGKGYLNKKGYLLICYKDSVTQKFKRKYQHVLVMMHYIGRELFPHERVHHKNGIRNDNRLENLELWSISQPPGQRVEDKINWYIEFLKDYGYKVMK